MFSPPHLSFIQFAVFPIMLAIFAAISLRSIKVPRLFLGFALTGAAAACFFSYSFPSDPAHAVMLSTLKGDDYQSRSRMFREKINSYLHGRSSARAVGFYRVLSSYPEAAALMAGNSLKLVVWGNDHWLNISFSNTPARTVSEFAGAYDFSRLSKLQIVTSIPNIGLSFEPRNETADYIAGMTAALLPSQPVTEPLTLEELGRRELILMDTGNISGKWTAGAHRALPWWVLGNLYSYKILQSDRAELGEIRCAIDAYYKARSFLQQNDRMNADLWSAIHNNLAIMTALQSLVESKPKLLKRARRFFTAGAKIRHMPNVYQLDVRPAMVAKQNVHALKGYIQKKPHAKRKKKPGKKQ